MDQRPLFEAEADEHHPGHVERGCEPKECPGPGEVDHRCEEIFQIPDNYFSYIPFTPVNV